MITQTIEAKGLAKFIGSFESGSAAWHAARGGIGGSDIGVIYGKSQYKSQYRLWCEKTGELADFSSTIPMRLGTALEPAIRDFFAAENKEWLTVHETGTWQSVANPWQKANPDGIIEWSNGELGVLEIKHSSVYLNECPESWRLQVLWYLHVLGLDRGVISAVIGGRYTEFSVDKTDTLYPAMQEVVEAFYGSVLLKVAPPIDGSTSTYETIRQLSPGLTDGEVDLDNLWVNLVASKMIAESAESVHKANQSIVLAYMNGTKYGFYEGKKVVTLQARNGKPFITYNK